MSRVRGRFYFSSTAKRFLLCLESSLAKGGCKAQVNKSLPGFVISALHVNSRSLHSRLRENARC